MSDFQKNMGTVLNQAKAVASLLSIQYITLFQ